jgi:hypothetical protein
MKLKSIVIVLMSAHALLGCVAESEPVADGDLERVREAPASLQGHGIARYAAWGDGDTAELTLLSDGGEAVGRLSASKNLTDEALEISLALPGRDLAVSKSKSAGSISLNGRAATLDEARQELEIASDLLVEEGFLPEPTRPLAEGDEATLALQSQVASPGTESAYCSAPLRSGCYRSSVQSWACAQAVPGACFAGYCYESCSCEDDTKWYDLFPVYICCSYERCN